jgi:hypothetical protein
VQALRFGGRYGYVGRNVAQLVDLPPAPRREGRSLAIEQSERLLSAARGERLKAAIVTGLMLGLRPGELLGLNRTDYSPRRATRHNGMVGIEGHVTHSTVYGTARHSLRYSMSAARGRGPQKQDTATRPSWTFGL